MMSVLVNFLKLIRYKNILMIALTQVFTFYFLNPDIHLFHLLDTSFLLLLVCTAMVAAGGYIINDYMDVKLDLINKPEQVIVGKSISRRWAMFMHLLFTSFSFLIGISISKKIAVAVMACSFLLWIYSQFLKKTYLAGNLLVSFLSAFSLIILFVYKPNELHANGIYLFAMFAFLTTLIREIIKDMEDIKGDVSYQSRTIPIVSGIRKTKKILLLLIVLEMLLCFYNLLLFGTVSYSSNLLNHAYQVYVVLMLLLPLLLLYKLIQKADTKKAFTRLSFYFKLLMLLGILSMVFWRY
jgi:4-hydroxybenzoate polyprenyltransferase